MQIQARPLGGKTETLDHAIEAIRVRFGSQALTRVAELPPPLPWPSGTPLDRLTGIGGLPRGRLTLLTGTGTCGKLTLALALLAQATQEFAHAVVIDPARQFDPWAMLPFDPDLGSLTVITPPSAEAAGEAASALARAGAGFILLMGEIPEPWLAPMEALESGSEWGAEDRHTGICNMCFLDGHVKAMRPEAFYLGWNGIWFRADHDKVMPGDPKDKLR